MTPINAKRAQAHQSISSNDQSIGHVRRAALQGAIMKPILSAMGTGAILDRDGEVLAAILKLALVNKNLAAVLAAYLEKTRYSMTF